HTFLSSKKSMTKVPCRLFVLDKTTSQTPQQPVELGTKYALVAYLVPSNSPRLFCCSVDVVLQEKQRQSCKVILINYLPRFVTKAV
ncbi:MAG TPA: hypothetical protein PKB09_04455, partial [Candidatus Saccharibacteria bacterium]|nr:hypothetical protein [Candidatus Saccharibacteria bacterium]